MLIVDGEKRHYTAINSLSRLNGSSNSKDGHQQHICLNCLQGFHSEKSRDNHFKYCKDNKAVRIEMPKEGSFMEFHDGQNQFKMPFAMYSDFEAKLKPTEEKTLSTQKNRTLKKSINTSPLVSVCIPSLLMERLKIH